jgi:hypothetical protein
MAVLVLPCCILFILETARLLAALIRTQSLCSLSELSSWGLIHLPPAMLARFCKSKSDNKEAVVA